METDKPKNRNGLKMKGLLISLLGAAFLVYYSVMSIVGAARETDRLIDKFNPEKDAVNRADSAVYHDSAYVSMLKERAWLQSKTIMAATDSIYLTIDLNDSIADIAINGVIVHSSPISRFRISRVFKKGNEASLNTFFSNPLSITSSVSTIRKEPLMIKMAPKDTSEYKPDVIPDTAHTQPVNFVLNMTDNVNIYFYQDDIEGLGDWLTRIMFDFRLRLSETWRAVKSVAVLKVPEYHPYIKLYVSRADGRIIYRALPRKGQIGVLL